MPKNDVKKVNDVASKKSLVELSTFEYQKIGTHLAYKALKNLSLVSKTMFFYYAPLAKEAAPKTLSSHVLRGEEKEALNMIAAKPELLLCPSEASDYSGVPTKGSHLFNLLCSATMLLCRKRWNLILISYRMEMDKRKSKNSLKQYFQQVSLSKNLMILTH